MKHTSYFVSNEQTVPGKRYISGETFHTDHSNHPAPPKTTFLYPVPLPSYGGDTQYVNMHLAYDDLPDATKQRIDRLRAVHKLNMDGKFVLGGTRSRLRWSTAVALALIAIFASTGFAPAARANFVLQFSELETNDNGSLFVDTEAARGSNPDDANLNGAKGIGLNRPNKPTGFVFAPGSSPTTLPGFIPRLCGNENGNIGGTPVSKTCHVEITLNAGVITQDANGIAYLIEPPGLPDAGQGSDSLQVILSKANNTEDFFWRSDPSAADLLKNCNTRIDETGDPQTIGTFSTLDEDGRKCTGKTFTLPTDNAAGADNFTVTAQSDLEVPEPSSLILVGSALAGFGALRRRVKRAAH